MSTHSGGCLCDKVRYAAKSDPIRVTYCHCKFCQRATGSAYMVEPVFEYADFEVVSGSLSTYDHRSEGSQKILTINFCETCGTKLFLTFERFSDVVGIYGGTFDDPNWFKRTKDNSKHIFVDAAQHGTLIPANVDTYPQYSLLNDGTPVEPIVFSEPRAIGPDKPTA